MNRLFKNKCVWRDGYRLKKMESMTGVQILTESVVFTSHQGIWKCRGPIGNNNNNTNCVALCPCDSWGFYYFQTDHLSEEKNGWETASLKQYIIFLTPACFIERLSNTSFFTIAEWLWKSFTFPFKKKKEKNEIWNMHLRMIIRKMYEIIFINRKKIELF